MEHISMQVHLLFILMVESSKKNTASPNLWKEKHYNKNFFSKSKKKKNMGRDRRMVAQRRRDYLRKKSGTRCKTGFSFAFLFPAVEYISRPDREAHVYVFLESIMSDVAFQPFLAAQDLNIQFNAIDVLKMFFVL